MLDNTVFSVWIDSAESLIEACILYIQYGAVVFVGACSLPHELDHQTRPQEVAFAIVSIVLCIFFKVLHYVFEVFVL